MVCPKGWGSAFLRMLWEDDIKPVLINTVIILVYISMGIITGTLVVLFTLVLYKFTSLF